MNIAKLSLRALRDQINNGTREVTFRTDDGGLAQMVYIPKFRIPAGLWEGGGYPPQDLKLGGFFVDKYQCSHKAATSSAMGIAGGAVVAADSANDVALSLPGRVPWADIDQSNAKQACANRKINGVRCHLTTMKESATVAFLIKLLGHDIRGNNDWGRDYRDADAFENYGVKDMLLDSYAKSYNKEMARILTGSGPISWSHNGQANGIFDFVGNIWEWLDVTITDSVYRHVKTALINDADGITPADAAIVIDTIDNLANWPASGLCLIKAEGVNTDEYIRYTGITNNGDGTATLTGVQRAQEGTAASAHGDNAVVQQLSDYCLVPGGAKGMLGAAILAADAAITVTNVILGPGGAALAVGDTLQVGTEQMAITADNGGGTYSVTRGANGSTAADHAAGVAVVKLSPQMSNSSPSSTNVSDGAYQFGYLATLRKEADLMAMAIPYAANAQTPTEEYKDGFWARWTGQRAALRGGSWDSGSNARSGFALNLNSLPSNRNTSVGFRAALTL